MSIKFPEHKVSLNLTHNHHKIYYETIEEYLSRLKDSISDEDWATATSRERAIGNDELWELQWYPDTPVGCFIVFGASLEEVLKKANDEY